MLAVEKARRLEHQGFRVLLTCFNRPLAAYLYAQLKETPYLTISTYLELCQHWAAKANTLPSEVQGKDFFRSQLPEALLRAAERLENRFDAIIVDEGQDFRPNWWTPLQSLLGDPDHGILYIFYDDNQRIYRRPPSFPLQDPPFLLTVNCRNTQSIHNLVSKFYQSEEPPIALGPKGLPIEYAFYEGSEDLRPALGNVLQRLTNREQIPASAITVLTPFSQSKSRLWEQVSFQGPPLSNAWPAPPDQVKCCTIYEFKGLERTVIILAEVEEAARLGMADINGLMYVGSSRARNYLIIMLDRRGDRRLHEALGASG